MIFHPLPLEADINDNSTATNLSSVTTGPTSKSRDSVDTTPPINMQELTAKPVLILDLNFELLHNQVAYLPGALDRRGGPVIFFDTTKECWRNTDFDSGELARLLIYYFKIPRWVKPGNQSLESKDCARLYDIPVIWKMTFEWFFKVQNVSEAFFTNFLFIFYFLILFFFFFYIIKKKKKKF